MTEPTTMIAMAGFGLAALGIALWAGLKAWNGWLELKRLELTGTGEPALERSASMVELIEMADLRERIRKLESIASCIDL